jgi:3-methylfumaryl-CoA hydratase
LTFNGHRIHYDLDYARDVEAYAGLGDTWAATGTAFDVAGGRKTGAVAQFQFPRNSTLDAF